jgi:UDP-GlcNAc:undecaprenyl-phosphate GlcNAc-1-phosphate transferase
VQTQTLALTLLSCWALALVATPLMIRLASRYGWLDRPSDRKLHPGPVPYTGGIAVFASAILGICLVAPWSEAVRSVAFGSGSLAALGLGVVLIVALGAYDDLRDIPAFLKLAGQFAIAALTWFLGFRSGVLDLPFGWELGGGAVLSFAMTVGWIVLVTNAFNLIDGLDGLAAGVGIVAALTLVILGQSYDSAVAVIASLALAGALAAFLRFNLPPASIFLGDAGAMGIGYTTAVVALASYQRAPTAVVLVIPFVVLGLPLVDTLLAILRRTTNHVRQKGSVGLRPRSLAQAVMSADRSHIHHILLRSGWSIRGVLFVLYGLAAGLGGIALWARTITPAARWALWVGLMLGGVAVLYALERRLSEGAREADVAEARRADRRRAAG